MKYLISEKHNNLKIYFLRRLSEFESVLKDLLEFDDNPCWYDSKDEFIELIILDAAKQIYDFETVFEEIEITDFLKEKYSDKLIEIYDDAGCDE